MKEPVAHFFAKEGFDISSVMRYAIGEKFAGLMLKDGRIGICAILDAQVDDSLFTGRRAPDLTNHGHRIILNAYFNALFNYSRELPCNSDILERIDLKKFNRIVIVGYFESLVTKLLNEGIRFRIFDKDGNIESEKISPLNELHSALSEADAAIITGSTLANNTFLNLTSITPEGCSIFLLGPSNILHPDMFRYRNIKVVFGSVFERFDHRVLDMITLGHGARDFLTEKNKVCINHKAFSLL